MTAFFLHFGVQKIRFLCSIISVTHLKLYLLLISFGGHCLHLRLNFLIGLDLAQKKSPVLKSDFSAVHKNVFSLLFICETSTKVQMSLCSDLNRRVI